MTDAKRIPDGVGKPMVEIEARQLLGLVCTKGGLTCPLIEPGCAHAILARLGKDPTLPVQLNSNADTVPHYTTLTSEDYAQRDPDDAFNRKRDLDVLQRLGLLPGSIRRARYLFELLFARIDTPGGICVYDTPGWEGCPHARNGAYERIREEGWQAVVHARTKKEMRAFRERNVERIRNGEQLYVRPHHFMCLACGYAGGENDAPRPNDTLYEILERIRRQPDVPVTLVEGCCEACDCCDGFHPGNGRCVHTCGLIRDYKKDLDLFQKLGLQPGDTLRACDFIDLLFERIASTREICGYGDGIVTSEEWTICSGPEGNPGYEKTRSTGLL
ncbi:MAG: hypothetical protein GWP08_03705 [Nitrospiraceae bacterium]|nr:hypothetical protein [Nitrospiraceae bacterium]